VNILIKDKLFGLQTHCATVTERPK